MEMRAHVDPFSA